MTINSNKTLMNGSQYVTYRPTDGYVPSMWETVNAITSDRSLCREKKNEEKSLMNMIETAKKNGEMIVLNPDDITKMVSYADTAVQKITHTEISAKGYKMMKIPHTPMPKRIVRTTNHKTGKPAICVFWTDGTKTAVSLADGDEDSIYAAYCAALAKRIHGGTGNVHTLVDNLDETRIREEKKAEAKRKAAEKLEADKIAHEKRVRAVAEKLMKEDRFMQEVENYIDKIGADLCE